MRLAVLCLLASAVFPPLSRAQAPVFVITPEESEIKFYVKSSVDIEGHFDKWKATLKFTSPKISSGVLNIKIQAATVNTGSGMKDGKLKSKDFFDVEHDPVITFKSTKIVKTSPGNYQVQGNLTIRGVTKPDTLTMTADTEGKGIGEIKGTMAFDRKDYGMDGSIPFIKIADRVEVTVSFHAKRVSGPPVLFE
jgi:polyisoprenoid-binding protein YceI